MKRLVLTAVFGLLVCGGAAGQETSSDPAEPPHPADLVAAGDWDALEARLDSGLAPDAILTAAVRHESEAGLRLALERGADFRGLQASRALLRAKRQGLGWAEDLLQQAGADLEGRDALGRTLLILAIQDGDAARIRGLIAHGADVDAASNMGLTALMEAVAADQKRGIRTLLEAGAEIDAVDRDGWTALQWAVRLEKAESTRLLLSKGADPDHLDRLGWTPLLLAVVQDDPKLVNILLKRRADPNVGGPTTGPPLVRAVLGGNADIVRQLLSFGASRRVTFGNKRPLQWAAGLDRQDLVALLMPKGYRP